MDKLGKKDIVQVEVNNSKAISSASRTLKNVDEIPFTAYVITKQTIRERGYMSLVEVLKDLPGIKVSQPGTAQHGETFNLRGLFGNYYTKILMDNLPLQPSAALGMPLGEQIPLEAVERIEVIYGPASDLYGSDAMAGVINIITKRSEDIKWGNARLSMGTPFLTSANFAIGGKIGRNGRVYNYSMYGGFSQMRDKNIVKGHEGVYNPQAYSTINDSALINNPYYKGSADLPNFNGLPSESFHAGFKFSGDKLQIGFDALSRSEQSAIGYNPLYRTYHDPNQVYGENIFRGFGIYKTKLGEWNSRTYLSWLSYRLNQKSSFNTISNPVQLSGNFYSYSASDDLYFEENLNYSFENGLTFQTAFTFQFSGNFPSFDYFDEPFDPSDYKPWSTELKSEFIGLSLLGYEPINYTNSSVMAQLYYDNKKWDVLAGLRYDYQSIFGSSINPRIGISYKVNNKLNLRLSGGSAFRPPSSYIMFNSYKSYEIEPGVAILLPSPQFDLNAERLYSGEIGLRFFRNEHCSFDMAIFAHRRSNHFLKTSDYQDSIDFFYGYINDENASSTLFGIQAQHKITDLGRFGFFNDFSITYSKGNEVLAADRGTLNQYRETPNWIVKWFIGLHPVPDLSIGIRNHYLSSWLGSSTVSEGLEDLFKVDGFYNMDLIFDYKLSKSANAFINVYNVFNSKYAGITTDGGLGLLYGSGNTSPDIFIESLIYNPQYGMRFAAGIKVEF